MGKDPLFVNKIAAAVLSAGLLAMMAGFIASKLYQPKIPAEQAYVIAEVDAPAAAPTRAAPAEAEPIEPLLAEASVEAGERAARKCVACHTFEKGGPNRVGPNLWDIVGADHGHIEAYAYSRVLRDMEGPWDYEALNKFLFNPRAYAPGTKMAFAGIKDTQERADVVAYLRSLSDDPKPLPE